MSEKAKTVKIHIDGELVEAEVKKDQNGEVVVEAPNGRFLKFPTEEDLPRQVKAHNEANPLSK